MEISFSNKNTGFYQPLKSVGKLSTLTLDKNISLIEQISNELGVQAIYFEGGTLVVDDYSGQNNRDGIYKLTSTLEENKNCIIITHHMPSESLVDIKYKTPDMLPYNQWYYCDMDEFINSNRNKIKYWFYGHTHTPSEVIINEIPFLCNPIGYPNENKKVDFEKTQQIPSI